MATEKRPLRSVLDSLESGTRPKGGVRGITGGVPSLGGEHVARSGALRLDRLRYVPEAFFDRMRRGQIHPNDILVVKDGATTGRVALVPSDFPLNPVVANEHLFVCRPSTTVLPEYLFYFLLSPLGQQAIMENFRGSAQGGIVQSFADDVAVPLPDISTQQKVVGKVNEILERINGIASGLGGVGPRVSAAAEALARACFRGDCVSPEEESTDSTLLTRLTDRRMAALTGRAKAKGVITSTDLDLSQSELPEGWLWVALDQLIERGPQNGLYKPQTAYGKGVAIVRIEDFQNGVASPRDGLSRLQVSEAEREKFALRRGDIVINRVNSPSHLGKSFLVTDDLEGALFESNMMRLRVVDDDDVSSRWVARYLQSPPGREALLRNAKWAVNQASINQTDVRSVPIPLPSKEEQKAVMRTLDETHDIIASVRRRAMAAESVLVELRQRFLAQAFTEVS